MPTTIAVRNPRTGTDDYTITAADGEQIRAIAQRLRGAQRHWLELGVEGRIARLDAFKQVVIANRDELQEALETDTGRRWVSALEVDTVVSSIDRSTQYVRAVLGDETPTAVPGGVHVRAAGLPYPLVGVISPWNFPLQLALIDAVPALLAGCAVLIKPSEITPRFIPVLRRCLAAVPDLAAVVEVVEGAGETGQHVISAADVVCFTGSVRTGQAVARAAAERFVPAFLELGGKDPAIVTASADLDVASSAILWGSTINSGHSCMSIERVYVAAEVYERFVALLVEKAERVRLAHPTPADGEVGPIIAGAQVGIIGEHLADAVGKGATVRTGGTVQTLDGGAYLRPTVLTGVDHTMRVMVEETFGPIIPVMAFGTADEAVALANDTEFGLSAAVFAGDAGEAAFIAERIEAGGISINDVCLTGFFQVGEKNAFKLSGMGPSRMGPSSVRRFLRQRTLLFRDEARVQPWYYDGADDDA
ncbi:aldehyde dehydrogenase family protein [Dactylosporangium sucinum]|uniref:Aldehyde dehydrogenase n=1 Tax=Dactylosporangium sucinum TaxID=1424081 RepID=A0A917U059_9ACTN|nr:aldehyde dehydrogenase family protein [Dactylosporangium sucinum]GGM45921.1 aldehyde dehydrogenase [Dactylosporangium sucinum]